MKKIDFISRKKPILSVCLVVITIVLNTTVAGAQFLKLGGIQEDNSSIIINEEHYDFLIITTKNFANLLSPLIEHKNNVGISTRLVILQEIYEQTSSIGCDNQEKIKYFIKYAIEEWGIRYVLFVGGAKQIPVRYSNVHCFNLDEPDWQNFLMKSKFVSDLYYADIYDEEGNFSDWDSNGNGVYGEWTGETAEDKNIDLYPDVYLGRLPCRNRLEVRIMVNKIIRYETNTYGDSWFNTMVVVAGDTDPRWWLPRWRKYEAEITALEALSYMDGFTPVKLFASNGNLNGRVDVIKAINRGCGFIYFNGHGNPLGLLTYPPRTNDSWIRCIDVYTIPFLFNRDKLPICVIGSCSNSNFDVSLLKIFDRDVRAAGEAIPECWSWKLTSKLGGGSIATIGGTGIGFVNLDKESGEGAGSYLETRFFWEYGVNNTDVLGEVWGKAINNYLDSFPIDWNTQAGRDSSIDAETVENCVLLGDPTLKIGGYP